MAISEFLMDVFWDMVGVGGVLVTLQSLLTIKKGTGSSNFQSNEPFFEISTTIPSIQSALV